MRTLGNLIWFIFIGIGSCIGWFLLGGLWCITIIGIPFGTQCFKFATLTMLPFGKKVYTAFERHPIANLIWILFGGLELALGHLFAGILFSITIIGIPFGKQCFKLAGLALMPFGARILD